MASKRMTRRHKKCEQEILKKEAQRAELRKRLKDPSVSLEEKFEIQAAFHKLGRKSSRIRLNRRCALTGRPRGVYRTFGICRNEIRRLAMEGMFPGLYKSSSH